MTDRVLPHDLDAEKAVLGAVLRSDEAWAAAASVVRPSDFYRDAHRRIFDAMTRLTARAAAIDLLTLKDELASTGELDECGGPAYIAAMTDGVPKTANVGQYAVIVREKARLRTLIEEGNQLLIAAYDSNGVRPAAIADAAVRRIFRTIDADREGAISAHDAVIEYATALARGTLVKPIPTGHLDIDLLVGGFRPGDLVIVAARPSVGKTSFSLGLADRMARAGTPTAFFSLEQPIRKIAAQLLARRSRVPSAWAERGEASDEQYASIVESTAEFQEVKLSLLGQVRTAVEVAAWCRRLKGEGGLGCAFVDYLQLLVPSERLGSGHEELAETCHALKRLATDLDIALVALSQLSRSPEGRQDKRPHLADLRGSGALEQDADLALLLFREEMHKAKPENEGIAEVIFAKNRYGPTGVVKLAFVKQLATFEDLAYGGQG